MPQQRAVPAATIAQPCDVPSLRSTTWSRLITGVARYTCSVKVPLPSAAELFHPEHATVPSESNEQVVVSPQAIARTPVSPSSDGDSLASCVPPSPTAPSPFEPQHFIVPPESRAQ